MNIINLLQLLSEDRTIENITNQLEGKVSPQVIQALSSKMKKGKFDNEAMAILKGLQFSLKETKGQFPKEYAAVIKKKIEYLNSRASMIYSILKKLKVGDSAFDADKIISDYIYSKSEPSAFWKEKYSQANNKPAPLTKEQKKFNTVGLATARTKDLGDCFAILPKNFKAENGEWGFKEIDYDKSHEELKTLSAEMAQRDTTDDPNAKVNHWCVAASDSGFFNSYKGKNGNFGWNRGNGDFIIFVEKNKDGSPNWNNRYLTWFSKNGTTELADKYDHHIQPDKLPKGAQKFFEKAMVQKRNRNRPDEKQEISRRIKETKDEREVTSVENEVGRKIIDYAFELARKGKENQASQVKSLLKKELKARGMSKFMDMLDYLDEYRGYQFWTKMANRRPFIQSKYGHNDARNEFVFKFGPIEFEGTAEEVLKFLDKCVADPSLIVKKMDEGFVEEKKKAIPMIADKFEFGAPTKNMLLSLGGNEKVMEKYFISREKAIKEGKQGRIFIPSTKSLRQNEGIDIYFGTYGNPNEVQVHHNYRWETMGDRNDPATFEKLKKTIETIINDSNDYSWIDKR